MRIYGENCVYIEQEYQQLPIYWTPNAHRSDPKSWLSLVAEEKFRRHTPQSGLVRPIVSSGRLFLFPHLALPIVIAKNGNGPPAILSFVLSFVAFAVFAFCGLSSEVQL